eukprot:GHVQ01024460.1.p1 GENE.GHVQ01024460.1~~GHVQ01024460.1.p1  ORF type:complete len:1054 (+),score=195.48 GHVQ01024460.1:434-3595(+)
MIASYMSSDDDLENEEDSDVEALHRVPNHHPTHPHVSDSPVDQVPLPLYTDYAGNGDSIHGGSRYRLQKNHHENTHSRYPNGTASQQERYLGELSSARGLDVERELEGAWRGSAEVGRECMKRPDRARCLEGYGSDEIECEYTATYRQPSQTADEFTQSLQQKTNIKTNYTNRESDSSCDDSDVSDTENIQVRKKQDEEHRGAHTRPRIHNRNSPSLSEQEEEHTVVGQSHPLRVSSGRWEEEFNALRRSSIFDVSEQEEDSQCPGDQPRFSNDCLENEQLQPHVQKDFHDTSDQHERAMLSDRTDVIGAANSSKQLELSCTALECELDKIALKDMYRSTKPHSERPQKVRVVADKRTSSMSSSLDAPHGDSALRNVEDNCAERSLHEGSSVRKKTRKKTAEVIVNLSPAVPINYPSEEKSCDGSGRETIREDKMDHRRLRSLMSVTPDNLDPADSDQQVMSESVAEHESSIQPQETKPLDIDRIPTAAALGKPTDFETLLEMQLSNGSSATMSAVGDQQASVEPTAATATQATSKTIVNTLSTSGKQTHRFLKKRSRNPLSSSCSSLNTSNTPIEKPPCRTPASVAANGGSKSTESITKPRNVDNGQQGPSVNNGGSNTHAILSSSGSAGDKLKLSRSSETTTDKGLLIEVIGHSFGKAGVSSKQNRPLSTPPVPPSSTPSNPSLHIAPQSIHASCSIAHPKPPLSCTTQRACKLVPLNIPPPFEFSTEGPDLLPTSEVYDKYLMSTCGSVKQEAEPPTKPGKTKGDNQSVRSGLGWASYSFGNQEQWPEEESMATEKPRPDWDNTSEMGNIKKDMNCRQNQESHTPPIMNQNMRCEVSCPDNAQIPTNEISHKPSIIQKMFARPSSRDDSTTGEEGRCKRPSVSRNNRQQFGTEPPEIHRDCGVGSNDGHLAELVKEKLQALDDQIRRFGAANDSIQAERLRVAEAQKKLEQQRVSLREELNEERMFLMKELEEERLKLGKTKKMLTLDRQQHRTMMNEVNEKAEEIVLLKERIKQLELDAASKESRRRSVTERLKQQVGKSYQPACPYFC